MDPAQLPPPPPGGLPWSVALWVIGGLVTAILGLAAYVRVQVSGRARDARLAAARLDLEHATKEKIRREYESKLEACERRSDALEKEMRAQLEDALDGLYSQLYGRPPRAKDPPPSIQERRRKRSTSELLQDLRTATGRFRRDDLADDVVGTDTQP